MGHHDSSKAAHVVRLTHHHRGHGIDNMECDEDPHDKGYMKRDVRAEGHRATTATKQNRASERISSNDFVQNWLANTNIPRLDTAARSVGVANHSNAHHKQSSQDYGDEIWRESSYRRGTSWQPQHLVSGNKDLFAPITATRSRLGYQRKKRYISDDSSLLSVAQHHRASTSDPLSIQQNVNDETQQRDVRKKPVASDDNSSHQQPSTPEYVYFERRPRYKTRKDKYDTRKETHKHKTYGADMTHHTSKKRRNEDKKKVLHSSRNVMKNFNSDVVLRERVTMPQSLRPGLFKNGRHATIKPVGDLSFSNMRFLQEKKQDIASKQLSKRRLQELERQNKEIEEISAFFLPEKPSSNNHILQQGPGELIAGGRVPGAIPEQCFGRQSDQDTLEASIYPHTFLNAGAISSRSYDHADGSSVRSAPNVSQESSKASKTTTYFTWSRSPTRSPFQSERQVSLTSSCSSIRQNNIPDSIRKLLVDTGIFKGTGISGYDDESANVAIQDESAESISSKVVMTTDIGNKADSGHCVGPNCTSTIPEDPSRSLMARWQATFTPKWQSCSQQGSKAKNSFNVLVEGLPRHHNHTSQAMSDPRREDPETQLPGDKSIKFERLRGSAENCLGRRLSSEIPSKIDSHCILSDMTNNVRRSDIQSSSSAEKASVASRDIMPPPPLPPILSAPTVIIPSDHMELTPPTNRHIPAEAEISAVHKMIDQFKTQAKTSLCTSTTDCACCTTCMPVNESAFSDIQPASWLPRPVTPSTSMTLQSINASRDSSRPLYTGQATTSTNHKQSISSTYPLPGKVETMADYIARIEHEIQDKPACQYTEEAMTSIENPSYEQPRDTHPSITYQGYSTIESHHTAEEEDIRLNSGFGNSGWQHDLECGESTGLEAICDETSRFAPIRVQVPRDMQHVDDLEEERYEMSTFWRPNQFMQF
ncbi:hypothetical protein BKA67DRAFT_366739 [Truncatella angustata]|uniref:Uncharacterized protein n=1 Tax=Truncatella angustata TaxID=152316 RepID=A0A9P8UEP7_9PEZI|nr:uncharacterized protein BKA67DRAFT_366739 [Truncatella angustata]KAH6648520.1 hypothetical protein BKA67DRAFT_366739 [Truncatella angustata]